MELQIFILQNRLTEHLGQYRYKPRQPELLQEPQETLSLEQPYTLAGH